MDPNTQNEHVRPMGDEMVVEGVEGDQHPQQHQHQQHQQHQHQQHQHPDEGSSNESTVIGSYDPANDLARSLYEFARDGEFSEVSLVIMEADPLDPADCLERHCSNRALAIQNYARKDIPQGLRLALDARQRRVGAEGGPGPKPWTLRTVCARDEYKGLVGMLLDQDPGSVRVDEDDEDDEMGGVWLRSLWSTLIHYMRRVDPSTRTALLALATRQISQARDLQDDLVEELRRISSLLEMNRENLLDFQTIRQLEYAIERTRLPQHLVLQKVRQIEALVTRRRERDLSPYKWVTETKVKELEKELKQVHEDLEYDAWIRGLGSIETFRWTPDHGDGDNDEVYSELWFLGRAWIEHVFRPTRAWFAEECLVALRRTERVHLPNHIGGIRIVCEPNEDEF